MLFKDNKPYKLSQEEVKEHSGKRVFILSRDMKRVDFIDQRIRKPNSLIIQPWYKITDPETKHTSEIRYAETSPQMVTEAGIQYQTWNPSMIEFPQKGSLTVENDPEMSFFLSNHPKCADSPNHNKKKKASFFIENKVKDAKEAMKKEKARFDALALILSPTDALPKEELISIARSYPDLIGFCDEWAAMEDDNQLKDALRRKAELNPELFFRTARNPKTGVKSIVNQAIRANMLKYVHNKRSWYVVENNEEKEVVCNVKEGKKALDVIVDHLTDSDKKGHLKYFETKLATKGEETPAEA